MLIEFDEWPMTRCNIITDVVTDVQRQDMDPRIENLRRGPVDQSYIGGLDIQEHEADKPNGSICQGRLPRPPLRHQQAFLNKVREDVRDVIVFPRVTSRRRKCQASHE